MYPAAWVSPVQIDPKAGIAGNAAQAEVQVGAALPGVAIPSIHLSHKPPSVWEVNGRSGTDGRPPCGVRSRMARTGPQTRPLV